MKQVFFKLKLSGNGCVNFDDSSKQKELLEARRGLIEGTLQNPHKIKALRKEIARSKTFAAYNAENSPKLKPAAAAGCIPLSFKTSHSAICEAVMASWLLSLLESSAFSVCHKKEAMSSPQISLILSIVWRALGYSAHTSCSIPLNCAPCPENKKTYSITFLYYIRVKIYD